MKFKAVSILICGCFILAVLCCGVCLAKEEEKVSTEAKAKPKMSREQRRELSKEMRELAKSDDEAAFSKLTEYALSPNPQIRRIAARAIGRSKNKEAFGLLLTLINDEDKSVRGAAAMSMGYQRDERAYDTLVKVSNEDESSEVKGKAVYGLGQLRTEKGQEKILEALGSDLGDVRKNAARALGRSRDKKAIEPLIKALGDKNDSVRENAAKSLKRLTGQEELYEKTSKEPADKAQAVWEEWWKKNKDTFEIPKRGRRPTRSAKGLIEQHDKDKDGALNEKELQEALDNLFKRRESIKKGTLLKTDVTVQKVDGKEAKLADFLKGTTVIFYMSGKCPHSVKAEGAFKEVYDKCKGKGINVVGVAASRESLDDLKSYLKRSGIKFPVVLDYKKEFSSKNHVRGTPGVIVIGKDGKVIDSYRGLPERNKEKLIKSLDKLAK